MKYTTTDLPKVAADLLGKYGHQRVYALLGELGAGKTTLVAEMCQQLGVAESTSSPTFSIVNQYDGDKGIIYHLDCYRLNSLEEAIHAGLEELLAEATSTVFIEWPGVIEALLPEDTVVLRLSHSEDGASRTLIAEPL
ncbi:tRNA (adenosine(37)-N6)-threonylcarbamoyltransferase complex ATPase subunit type 1 TsaE [Neolewinella persica]|uniref:tRNA (adenosine(37)-N6)-threonylcarbamoyltransferase complex ATPase subunit type 1 TsaE n=1 Tax=Neolewinella persica TaxID=70998 RepID=UPI0003759487|nr:tRNA (adenosine(37)-N6)-threonylcarbamoyltransferase complex ATPase subunit type 1 TsaE [Neolewinella persica]